MPGKGEYYKNKYGGGGRGGGGGGKGGGGGGHSGGGGGKGKGGKGKGGADRAPSAPPTTSLPSTELTNTLRRLDGSNYGAYHELERALWVFNDGAGFQFTLTVDRVQSDPFAPPSKMHVNVPAASARMPPDSHATKPRAVALADFLARAFARNCVASGADQGQGGGGGGYHSAKGGDLKIDGPSQHVLERTAVMVDPVTGDVECRFTVAMPARGRSIMGAAANEILTAKLPQLVYRSLFINSLDAAALRAHVLSVEDQQALRGMLAGAGLVAL